MSQEISKTVIRQNPLTQEVKDNVATAMMELAAAHAAELKHMGNSFAMAAHGISTCPKINAELASIKDLQNSRTSTQQAAYTPQTTTKPRGFVRT